jgi:hypothetical protein
MEFAWRRALALLGMVVVGLWSFPCLAQDGTDCSTGDIAVGQRTVTPAVVIGAPAEHLALKAHNPAKDEVFYPPADGGYVITGDPVDLVTRCGNLSYVRFHGKQKVSTGWVETSRLHTTGSPYVPLPPGAPELCKAAQDMLDAGDGMIEAVPTVHVTDAVAKKLDIGQYPNASLPAVARVTSGSHRMAVALIDGGGTAHSTEAMVFTPGMEARLSPPDMESRRIQNNGENGWAAMNESLVMVRGQPMIFDKWRDQTNITFAAIDTSGDIVPVCSGARVPTPQPAVEVGFDGAMCRALLASDPKESLMGPPSAGESMFLAKVPEPFEPGYLDVKPSAALHFRNPEEASEVSYNLVATGNVDLDGSGHTRRVGLVSYFDGDSTAGDGSYQESWFLPVYLDAQGRADPGSAENQALAQGLPSDGMRGGRLVTYQNAAYLELSPDEDDRITEIWKFEAKGPRKVCGFRQAKFELHVVTAEDHGPPS